VSTIYLYLSKSKVDFPLPVGPLSISLDFSIGALIIFPATSSKNMIGIPPKILTSYIIPPRED